MGDPVENEHDNANQDDGAKVTDERWKFLICSASNIPQEKVRDNDYFGHESSYGPVVEARVLAGKDHEEGTHQKRLEDVGVSRMP
jgi:hypothetical protein